jgi:hypothetical protein
MFDAPIAFILPHVIAAVAAFAAGVTALRTRPGSRTHRRAGKAYLAGWVILALMGMLMGHRHAALSAFEVLNAIGATVVLIGYAPMLVPGVRRLLAGADGRGWLRWHLRFMVGSLPFLVVAGLNQLLPLAGVAYSLPLLAATTVVATLVTRAAARVLLRRHGLLEGQVPIALA